VHTALFISSIHLSLATFKKRHTIMGTTHSKRTTEYLEQGAPPSAEHDGSAKNKDENRKTVLALDWHEARNDKVVSPFRFVSKATTMQRQEEEKIPESFSESDLRQMMQTMGNVNMDRRHHHHYASRAAVHPIITNHRVDKHHREQQHSSHNMPIESLPPPVDETKKRQLRGSSSLPVRCPSSSRRRASDSSFSEDGDSEYLSKLYDLRTWNMYRLITEARRKRQIEYQPSVVEEKTEMENEEYPDEELEDPSSFTADMVFAFDFE
jgi:hypothetical protein